MWVNKQHLLEKRYLRRYGRKILLELDSAGAWGWGLGGSRGPPAPPSILLSRTGFPRLGASRACFGARGVAGDLHFAHFGDRRCGLDHSSIFVVLSFPR